jgi:hypothetical protein
MNKITTILRDGLVGLGVWVAPFILSVEVSTRLIHDRDGAWVVGVGVYAVYVVALAMVIHEDHNKIKDEERLKYAHTQDG